MQAQLAREFSWVDAAEQHAQLRADQIGERLCHGQESMLPPPIHRTMATLGG
jgi:hypothetical protein